MNKEVESRAFYVGQGTKLKINDYLLREFLTEEGFAQFQISEKRTSRRQIFYNNDGILEIHEGNTIKTWLRNYFEDIADEKYDSGQE